MRKRDVQLRGGSDFIGLVGFDTDIITVTPTLDTSAYASGDLVADPVEIANAARSLGGRVRLDSIVVLDGDDQGVALNFVFTQVSTTFGTLNSAPNISDANLATVQGHVAFATTDYVDAGGAKIGTRSSLGLMMECPTGSASLYMAIVNGAGTPTFTAAGMSVKLGFTRY
jgi:hypothetical protein